MSSEVRICAKAAVCSKVRICAKAAVCSKVRICAKTAVCSKVTISVVNSLYVVAPITGKLQGHSMREQSKDVVFRNKDNQLQIGEIQDRSSIQKVNETIQNILVLSHICTKTPTVNPV